MRSLFSSVQPVVPVVLLRLVKGVVAAIQSSFRGAGNRGPDIRFWFALCQVQRRYPLGTLSCTASGTPEVRQNSGFSARVTHYKAASIGWFGFTPFLRVACVLARVRATA